MWMNRGEVEDAYWRFTQLTHHPVLGKAARFLKEFMEEVDNCSDGWPYWRLPSNAAGKLMDMLCPYSKVEATEANLKKAMAPIKAFYTRRGYKAGMKFPEIEL